MSIKKLNLSEKIHSPINHNIMGKIPIGNIILDQSIYPREKIDQRRVGIFAENIRDGFTFDPPVLRAFPPRHSLCHAKEADIGRNQPLCGDP